MKQGQASIGSYVKLEKIKHIKCGDILLLSFHEDVCCDFDHETGFERIRLTKKTAKQLGQLLLKFVQKPPAKRKIRTMYRKTSVPRSAIRKAVQKVRKENLKKK